MNWENPLFTHRSPAEVPVAPRRSILCDKTDSQFSVKLIRAYARAFRQVHFLLAKLGTCTLPSMWRRHDDNDREREREREREGDAGPGVNLVPDFRVTHARALM